MKRPVATPEMLRQFRERWDVSQSLLADDLGLGLNTISRWETGQQTILHPEMVALALESLAHRYRQRRGRWQGKRRRQRAAAA